MKAVEIWGFIYFKEDFGFGVFEEALSGNLVACS